MDNPDEAATAQLQALAEKHENVTVIDLRDPLYVGETMELTCPAPIKMQMGFPDKRKYKPGFNRPSNAYGKKHRGGAW